MNSAEWQAIVNHDPALDGSVYYAVITTGIYCRPSCPSRRPRPENVRTFDSVEAAEAAGFRACLRCKPRDEDFSAALASRLTKYLAEHPEEKVTLAKLSAALGVSPFHLQRSFKKATGVSPRAYAEAQRTRRFSSALKQAPTVTDAVYDAGFATSSRAYAVSESQLGMAPGAYRNGAENVAIRYTTTTCEFGYLLVAATARGICAVRLGDTEEAVEKEFRAEFSHGSAEKDEHLQLLLDQVLVLIGSSGPHPAVPLDIRATAFQRRVWEHLRSIPRGETRTYSQVAAALGQPKAVRAVARACATNPVAVAIPCHRVIASNGEVAGYRWGVKRKMQLLEAERA